MNRYRNLGIAFLAGTLLLAGFASNALAAGTAACTTINNRATLSYAVGGVSQSDIESAPGAGNSNSGAGNGTDTAFKVATKVDLTVATVISPKTATGTDQVLTYSITNTGNDTQRYGLQLYAGATTQTYGAGTDAFDMTNVRVYTDTDNDYSNGGTTVIANPAATNGTTLATLTANVAANGVIYVHIVSDVPAGRAAGDDAIYTLKAKTYQIATLPGTDGNNGTETGNSSTAGDLTENGCGPTTGVALADGDKDFTDTAVGGATDGANDGDSYATGYYEVATANISVAKTATILWDPVNGDSTGDDPIAIPGAYVRYTITISNAAGAGASATLTTITDALAASLAIDPDLIDGTSAAPTPGDPTNAAGDGFMVTHVSGRALATPLYYSTAADADGVEHNAGTITATFATLLPAEAGYTVGELKANESVTLTFNVIIQ